MAGVFPSDCRWFEPNRETGERLLLRTAFWPPRLVLLPSDSSRMAVSGVPDRQTSELLRQHGFLERVEFRSSEVPVARLALAVHVSDLRAGRRAWIVDRISTLAKAGHAHELVLRVQFEDITSERLVIAGSFLDELRSRMGQDQRSSAVLSLVAQGALLPNAVPDLLRFIDAHGASPIVTPSSGRRSLAVPEGPEADAVDALATTGMLLSLRLPVDDGLSSTELRARLSGWRAISRGGGLLLVPVVSGGQAVISAEDFADRLLDVYGADLVPADRLYPLNLLLAALCGWFPGFCYACNPAVGAWETSAVVIRDVLRATTEHPCADRRRLVAGVFSGEDQCAGEQWTFLLLNWLHFGCFDSGLTSEQWQWILALAERCLPELLRDAAQELTHQAARRVAREQRPPVRKRAVIQQGKLRIVEELVARREAAVQV